MVDEHDPALAEEIFAAMKANGTRYVPTHLTRWVDAYADDARVRDDPAFRYLHPLMKWQWLEDVDATLKQDPSPAAREAYRDFYRKGLELTGAAHRAGVRILAGTDYIVAGHDLHRELEQLVVAGLSPADALFAATVAPAEYYGSRTDMAAWLPVRSRICSSWKRTRSTISGTRSGSPPLSSTAAFTTAPRSTASQPTWNAARAAGLSRARSSGALSRTRSRIDHPPQSHGTTSRE
jgi:hypothetical protein